MTGPSIFLVLLVTTCFISCHGGETNTKEKQEVSPVMESVKDFMSDVWNDGAGTLRILWRECSGQLTDESVSVSRVESSFGSLMGCAKRKTLKALDRSLSSDVIPLGQGVRLVRYKAQEGGRGFSSTKYDSLKKSETSKKHDPATKGYNATLNGGLKDEDDNGEWPYEVLERIAGVFNTHVLKFDLGTLMDDSPATEVEESRHRRRHHMVQMMMFGIMSMGMILVPMGFQFLAVLGGKALLLAKLALILSSIQGLKKVATSPLNYGFYQSYQTPSLDTPIPAFEKRGYTRPPPPGMRHPLKYEDWPPMMEEKVFHEPEKYKFRFDSSSKTWRNDYPRHAKRSSFSILNGQNVFPVYSVSPADSGYAYLHQSAPQEFSSPGITSSVDHFVNPSMPGEVHAEYTIDLPVNKVQLKSSTPI